MQKLIRLGIFKPRLCTSFTSSLVTAQRGRFNSSSSSEKGSPKWSHNDGKLRLSRFWIKTGGVTAALGEEDATHQLLVRAGYLRQAHAGIFHYLPLGLRVQEKVEKLIDKHMRSVDAHKLALSSITSEALWTRSGRYTGNNPELFKLHGAEKSTGYLLSPTHEEEITQLVSGTVSSYKDLPLRLYQIGRKYRNELRPRRGLLRAREFVMKDLYTFDLSNAAALETYNQVKEAYTNFFNELRIPYVVVDADSGDMGGNLSHEFQCIGVDGEDTIASCDSCSFAANEEVLNVALKTGDVCQSCKLGIITVQKAIELGHTFYLGTRYSEPLEAMVEVPAQANSSSRLTPLEMGCHGIGVSRLIAAVAESLKDSTGLNWPRVMAPFEVVIVPSIGLEKDAEAIYDVLTKPTGDHSEDVQTPIEAVLDDRDKPMGWKFKDAELIGVPIMVVIGRRWQQADQSNTRMCEVHCRRLHSEPVHVPEHDVATYVKSCLERI